MSGLRGRESFFFACGAVKVTCLRGRESFLCLRGRESFFFACEAVRVFFACGAVKVFLCLWGCEVFFVCGAVKVSLPVGLCWKFSFACEAVWIYLPAGPWKFPLLRRPRNFLCLRSRESSFVCGAVKVFFVCGDQSIFFACEAVKVSLSALSFKNFLFVLLGSKIVSVFCFLEWNALCSPSVVVVWCCAQE